MDKDQSAKTSGLSSSFYRVPTTNDPKRHEKARHDVDEFTVQKHNSSSIMRGILGLVGVSLVLIVGLGLLINHTTSSSSPSSTSSTSSVPTFTSTSSSSTTKSFSTETLIFFGVALVVVIVMMVIVYQYHAISRNQQCTISSTHIVVKQDAGRGCAEETKIPLENVRQVLIRADSLVIETQGRSFDGPEQQEVQIHGVVNTEQVRNVIFARRASSLDTQEPTTTHQEGGQRFQAPIAGGIV